MRDLKHVGCYHGWIEDSFPEERIQPKEKPNRKLWRIDQVNDKQYLLIVSENKPDLKKLEKYGVRGSASTKNYDAFLSSLQEGMKAKFRVKLNAVKSHSNREMILSVDNYCQFLLKICLPFLWRAQTQMGLRLTQNKFV